jgi:hypothetical protein
VLVAQKDPGRHPRVASRWLLRYLEEDPHATIEEAVLAASRSASVPSTRRRGRCGGRSRSRSASGRCPPPTVSSRFRRPSVRHSPGPAQAPRRPVATGASGDVSIRSRAAGKFLGLPWDLGDAFAKTSFQNDPASRPSKRGGSQPPLLSRPAFGTREGQSTPSVVAPSLRQRDRSRRDDHRARDGIDGPGTTAGRACEPAGAADDRLRDLQKQRGVRPCRRRLSR